MAGEETGSIRLKETRPTLDTDAPPRRSRGDLGKLLDTLGSWAQGRPGATWTARRRRLLARLGLLAEEKGELGEGKWRGLGLVHRWRGSLIPFPTRGPATCRCRSSAREGSVAARVLWRSTRGGGQEKAGGRTTAVVAWAGPDPIARFGPSAQWPAGFSFSQSFPFSVFLLPLFKVQLL